MAEGARLESVYTLTAYRGFESRSLRQIKEPSQDGFFMLVRARMRTRKRVRQNGRIAILGAL